MVSARTRSRMIAAFPPVLLAAIAVVALLAGLVNGVAGFGFALVGTMVLATVLSPATAVVLLIVPLMTVNLSLVRELSWTQLTRCGRRFWPLLAAALVGTVVGMVLLERLPEDPLRVALGALTLVFVASEQRLVPLFDASREGPRFDSIPSMIGVGALSGLVFGGTNVGIQLVAYLRSRDLSHDLFIGVVALVFLGINAVRVGTALSLGLYADASVLGVSIAASVPAVLGVGIGKRVRPRIDETHRRAVVLSLLTVIGLRLIVGGLGIA